MYSLHQIMPSKTPPSGIGLTADRKATLGELLNHGVHPALVDIGCAIVGPTATITGQTATFYLKQVAQETALRLKDVQQVKNEITVRISSIGGGTS